MGQARLILPELRAPLTHEIDWSASLFLASGSQKTWTERAKSGFLPKLMVKHLTYLALVSTWVQIQSWLLNYGAFILGNLLDR